MYKRLVQRQNARRGNYVRPERVEFTYDDNPNYKGPIVEGWPPTQNRNVTSYVNPRNNSDFILKPKGRLHFPQDLADIFFFFCRGENEFGQDPDCGPLLARL